MRLVVSVRIRQKDLLDDIQLAEVELKYAERMNKILFEGYSVGFGQVTNPDEMKAMFGRDGIHAKAFRSYLSERFNLSPSIAELTGEQDLLRQFRESQILPLVITLLDDWAPDIEDSEFKADVLRLNSLLDQNETRTAIRQAVIDDDLMQILEIADLADQEQFSAETFRLLLKVPDWEGEQERLFALIDLADDKFPNDFLLRMISLYHLQFQAGAAAYRNQFLEAASAAVALRPKNASALFHFGMSQMIANRFENAADSFRRVTEVDPKDLMAYAELAMCHNRLQNKEEALAVLRQSVALNPERARSHGMLGQYLLDLGQYEESLNQLQHCLVLLESSPFEEEGKHYEFDVALCLAHLKRPDESFEAYTAGRKKYPNVNLESYLGELFQQQQRYDYWYVTIADRAKLATENTPETVRLRYDLARAAVVIAVHHREDEQGGILWRQKAASAFQDCLDAAGELLKSNESTDLDRSKVLAMLASVQARPDFAPVRLPLLEQLTEDEQTQWTALWAKLGELIANSKE